MSPFGPNEHWGRSFEFQAIAPSTRRRPSGFWEAGAQQTHSPALQGWDWCNIQPEESTSHCLTAPAKHVSYQLAPNAHAVCSPILIGCTDARRYANAWSNPDPGSTYTNAWSNTDSRSTYAGGYICGGPRHTTFRYAYGLAINDGTRRQGGEPQAQGQCCG